MIIFCVFSSNRFIEECFTFQWGGVCFSDAGASFLSGHAPHGGASVLMWGRLRKNW